jgi:hypothetical protein
MTTTSDTTIDEYVLMAEYDLHVIADQDDYLLFIAGLYRRAGVLKDGYPEELFDGK